MYPSSHTHPTGIDVSRQYLHKYKNNLLKSKTISPSLSPYDLTGSLEGWDDVWLYAGV